MVGDCRIVSSSSSGRFDWKGFSNSTSLLTVCTLTDVDVVRLLLDVVVPTVVVVEVVVVVVVVVTVVVTVVVD